MTYISLRVQFSDAGPRSRQNPAFKLLDCPVFGISDAALDLLRTLHLLCPRTARLCEVVEFALQDSLSSSKLQLPQSGALGWSLVGIKRLFVVDNDISTH